MTSLTSLAIFSDSVGRGAGDSQVSPVGRGDYLAGTSPTAPYINIGNYGWIERSIAGLYPYINFAQNGKLASAVTSALMPKQLLLLDKVPPTSVIISLGVNDLLGAASGAIVETRIENIITMCKNRYTGVLAYITTITPVSNSTDTWATLGNQSLSGTLPNGTTPSNWALFTDNTGTTGRSLYNARVRASLIAGMDGFIDSSAEVEAATDERYWGNSLTGDGIHPNLVGHTTISLCYDPEVLFG